MSERWGTRKYCQRKFVQAASGVDTAIDHLLWIHGKLGPTHERERQMIEALCAAGQEYKDLILDARAHF